MRSVQKEAQRRLLEDGTVPAFGGAQGLLGARPRTDRRQQVGDRPQEVDVVGGEDPAPGGVRLQDAHGPLLAPHEDAHATDHPVRP